MVVAGVGEEGAITNTSFPNGSSTAGAERGGTGEDAPLETAEVVVIGGGTGAAVAAGGNAKTENKSSCIVLDVDGARGALVLVVVVVLTGRVGVFG